MNQAPAPDPQQDVVSTASELVTPGLIHEMRHPLTAIKMGLDLLAARLGPALTSVEEWEIVGAQVAHLDEIFQAYQQFLSPGSGPIVDFEVEPVVRRAVSLLTFRLKRLGGRFSVEVERPLPPGRGHPQAVLHATTNLLTNALDALEAQERSARLEVRLLRAPGAPERVQIRVADEGSGIAPELRERIFEARFTTKAARNGTGLGLHVARRMMEAAGGSVTLLGPDAAARRPWSRTEFAVDVAAASVQP
jgi:signal transduction histidine kinase